MPPGRCVRDGWGGVAPLMGKGVCMCACVCAGGGTQVQHLAERDHGASGHVAVVNARLAVLLASGDADAAWALFASVTGWQPPPDHVLVPSLVPAPPSAGGAPRPTLQTYLPILRTVTDRYRDPALAATVAQSLLEHMRAVHGVRPDAAAYAAVITALADAGRGDAAHRLYEDMRAAGLLPSSRVFEALFRCLGRARAFDRVDALYADVVAAGIRPTRALSHVLISVCGMEPLAVALGAGDLDRNADAASGLVLSRTAAHAPAPLSGARRGPRTLFGGGAGGMSAVAPRSGDSERDAVTVVAGGDDGGGTLRPRLERLGLPVPVAAYSPSAAAPTPLAAAAAAAAVEDEDDEDVHDDVPPAPPAAAAGDPRERLDGVVARLFAGLAGTGTRRSKPPT
jgi:pentatricopeptide repeat protein